MENNKHKVLKLLRLPMLVTVTALLIIYAVGMAYRLLFSERGNPLIEFGVGL